MAGSAVAPRWRWSSKSRRALVAYATAVRTPKTLEAEEDIDNSEEEIAMPI